MSPSVVLCVFLVCFCVASDWLVSSWQRPPSSSGPPPWLVPWRFLVQSVFCWSLPPGILRKVTSTFETSRPTWVSVQDVVLNKLRPSTQPSQPLPELSHFYHNTQETRCLLMSLWFLLVCHSLTQNRCGVAS